VGSGVPLAMREKKDAGVQAYPVKKRWREASIKSKPRVKSKRVIFKTSQHQKREIYKRVPTDRTCLNLARGRE